MKEIRKPGGPKNERGKCSMFIKGARNGPDSKRRWDGVAEWTACIVTSPGYVPVSFLCVFQICLEFVVWQYIWLGLVGRGKLQRKNIREALKIQSSDSVEKIQSKKFSWIQLFVGEYLHTLSMRTAPSLASLTWDTIAYVGGAYRYPGMVQ